MTYENATQFDIGISCDIRHSHVYRIRIDISQHFTCNIVVPLSGLDIVSEQKFPLFAGKLLSSIAAQNIYWNAKVERDAGEKLRTDVGSAEAEVHLIIFRRNRSRIEFNHPYISFLPMLAIDVV